MVSIPRSTRRPLAWRAGIVALLAWLAVEIHESGHFLTYTLLGYRARMSFQRVTPLEAVPPMLDHWAKFAGPALSIAAAVVCLLIARRRHSFVWVTASFTNATIRLLPLVFDVSHALKGARPFSDEGEIALAFTSSPTGRAAILVGTMLPVLALSVLAAREYRCERRPVLTTLGVIGLSLVVWIGVVLLDELLGLNR